MSLVASEQLCDCCCCNAWESINSVNFALQQGEKMDAEHGDLQDCCWRSTEGIGSFMDVVGLMLPRLASLFVHPGVACCAPVALAVSLLPMVTGFRQLQAESRQLQQLFMIKAQALDTLCGLIIAQRPQLLLSW